MEQPLNSRSSSGSRGAGRWSGVAYLLLGMVIGAPALFVGIVTMFVGLIPLAIVSAYVWRDAGRHRSTFVGGSMIGIGLFAWPILGQAITNTDPAVHYDSGTVPVLIAALVVGAIGVVVVAIATGRARTRAVR